MFGSFLPGLGWLAPPKSIRAWEPTLLWNQLHSSRTAVLWRSRLCQLAKHPHLTEWHSRSQTVARVTLRHSRNGIVILGDNHKPSARSSCSDHRHHAVTALSRRAIGVLIARKRPTPANDGYVRTQNTHRIDSHASN